MFQFFQIELNTFSIGEIQTAGTMAFEGLVRVHGHGTRCCPSRGWSWRGWENPEKERWKFVGKIRKPCRNVLDFHCFVKHSSLQVCFLANPSFNDYKYFLEYGSTSTLQLTLQDPTNSRNGWHDFWRHGFQDFLFHPKKRISFNMESRHHDNISAWPGAGSGSGFGDYVGPRLFFFVLQRWL